MRQIVYIFHSRWIVGQASNPSGGLSFGSRFFKRTLLEISRSGWARKTGLTSPNFEAATSSKTRHIFSRALVGHRFFPSLIIQGSKEVLLAECR